MSGIANWPWEFIAGILIVATAASLRFNTPDWSRSYTTAAGYHAALALYVLFESLVFYIAAAIARLADTRSELADGAPLRLLASPVVIALLAVWLLPFVPLLERWPRRALLRLAGIPHEGTRLASTLFDANFQATTEVESTVMSILIRRGYDPTQQWLPVAEPLQKLWLKTAITFQELHRWESEPKYRAFIAASRHDFDRLRQRFDQLSLKMPRTLTNIERLGVMIYQLSPADADPNDQAAAKQASASRDTSDCSIETTVKKCVSDMLGDLQEDVAFLFQNMCIFIARGVLSCEHRVHRRQRRLRALGFIIDNRQPMQPVNVFLYAFSVFVFCLLISFSTFGTSSDIEAYSTVAFRIVMIATIQTTALAVAIIPKTLWGFANAGIVGHTPIRFVLLAGIVAAVLSVALNLGFGVLIYQSAEHAFGHFFQAYPWTLMAFTSATVTAVLVQDNRWASTASRNWQRAKDAIVMGTSMCVSIYIVRMLLSTLLDQPTIFDDPDALPRDLGLGAIAFVIGALIGFVVPGSFREGRSLRSRGGYATSEMPRPHASGHVAEAYS